MNTESVDIVHVARHFQSAMLVTHGEGHSLHGRPLSIAECDSDALWFATAIDSGKVDEIRDDSAVAVVLSGRRRYASVSGRAELVRDPARVQRLWKESWRPFFPGGPEDPNIVLLRVRVERGEYWDLTGLAGLRYALHALRALVTRTRASDASSNHHATIRPTTA
jgi:general stress protein 26